MYDRRSSHNFEFCRTLCIFYRDMIVVDYQRLIFCYLIWIFVLTISTNCMVYIFLNLIFYLYYYLKSGLMEYTVH